MDKFEKITTRQKMAWEGWFYAIQRIDLLIISISSGGVYVILEALKFCYEKQFTNISYLKISGCLLILAIIINFLSQITGKKANEYDLKMSNLKLIKKSKTTSQIKSDIRAFDCKSEQFTTYTNYLNTLSFLLMVFGLIILLLFFVVTF